MTSNAGGRFCEQCSQTVIDFTTWSDTALYEFFSKKTERVCGRFLNTQLNHPIHITHQPHSRLYRMTIALGLTLLFTQTRQLLAQTKPPKTVWVDTNKKAINAGSPYELPNADVWAYRLPAYTENSTPEATREQLMILGGPEPTDLVALAPGVYQQQRGANPRTESVNGKITGDKKQPLPGAIVKIYQDTNLKMSSITDVNGDYNIGGLLPGTYDLWVTYYGLDTFVTTGIVLQPGGCLYINASMRSNNNSGPIIQTSALCPPFLDQNNPTKRTFNREEIDHIPH